MTTTDAAQIRRRSDLAELFDPKVPNEAMAAGLLTRSGRHAFPSLAGGSGGDCAAFAWKLQLRG